MKFIILVTGWNCKGFVLPCYRSILMQGHKNWEAIFLSDGSTDGSGNEIKDNVQDPRCKIHLFDHNEGAAKRRYDALQQYGKKTDIVLLLGMDDQLLPGCLELILKQYQKGKWMTYGNWKDQTGEMLPKGFLEFDHITHELRNYRKVKFRSTAPNTFFKFLFDRIPEEDFMLDGKWIDSTTESEVMFSCLEMCGKEKIGIINQAIYLYNKGLPNGTIKRQGSPYKYAIYNRIITRPKKKLLLSEDYGK